MMCRAKEGFELAGIVRDFKKFTSKKIIQNIEDDIESMYEWFSIHFSAPDSRATKTLELAVRRVMIKLPPMSVRCF